MSDLKNQVESLLFSAGKRLTLEELSRLCKEENLDAIKAALEILKQELEEKKSSLMLVQEGDAYKLTVREQYIPVVKKVVKTPEMPKSILETLAVVAYKAPVLQSQVIKIRTNKAYRHLDELEELGYLTREKKGRSKLIKLTLKFFDYFDVVPDKLKEKFKNVVALEQAIEQKEQAAQQTQQAIIEAAKDTTPHVEIVTEPLPKLASEIEIIGDKIGLETYGEAPKKKKKKHKKKKAEEAEAPKTPEEAAEALAAKILGEAGIGVSEEAEAAPEEAAATESRESSDSRELEKRPQAFSREEGRITVEKIKAEAAKAKPPKKSEYTPKGLFAAGVPGEVQERIDHRVAEILEGEERPHEEGEMDIAKVPEVIPAPEEQPEESGELPSEAPEEEAPQAEEVPAEALAEEKPAEEPATPVEEEHAPPAPESRPQRHKKHH